MTLAEILGWVVGAYPEARYLLLRLAFRSAQGQPLDVGSKVLASEFGMPDAVFIKAKEVLIQQGVLANVRAQGVRGRPNLKLSWAIQWNAQNLSRTPHFYLIEALLSLCCRVALERTAGVDLIQQVRVSRSRRELSRVNCLLLAVLWSKADRFGVVEEMSSRLLSQMAGLEISSLKTRIAKLVRDGYVTQVIPGGFSRLLGGRKTSVYVLRSIAGGIGQRHSLVLQSYPDNNRFFRWSRASVKVDVQQLNRDPLAYGESPLGRYTWVVSRGENEAYFRMLSPVLAKYVQIIFREGLELSLPAICLRFDGQITKDFLSPKSVGEEEWSVRMARLNESLTRSVPGTASPWPELEPALKNLEEGESSGSGRPHKACSDLVFVISGFVYEMASYVHGCIGPRGNPRDWDNYRIIWKSLDKGFEGFRLAKLITD